MLWPCKNPGTSATGVVFSRKHGKYARIGKNADAAPASLREET